MVGRKFKERRKRGRKKAWGVCMCKEGWRDRGR